MGRILNRLNEPQLEPFLTSLRPEVWLGQVSIT